MKTPIKLKIMSITVGEVLQNSEYNLKGSLIFQREIGKRQEENYKIAIELGANDDDDWDEWEIKVEAYKELHK